MSGTTDRNSGYLPTPFRREMWEVTSEKAGQGFMLYDTRRFCCQHSWSLVVQTWLDLPLLMISSWLAGTPASIRAERTALARLMPSARLKLIDPRGSVHPLMMTWIVGWATRYWAAWMIVARVSGLILALFTSKYASFTFSWNSFSFFSMVTYVFVGAGGTSTGTTLNTATQSPLADGDDHACMPLDSIVSDCHPSGVNGDGGS
jgi:hypothetical protein